MFGANPIEPPTDIAPDPETAKAFRVTLMTVFRWSKNPKMKAAGWPDAVQINGRNYRSRRALDAFKEGLFRQALKARGGAAAMAEKGASRD